MSVLRVVVLSLLCLAALPTVGHAITLGEAHVEMAGGVSGTGFSGVVIQVAVNGTPALFEGIVLTPADVGRTFTVTGSDDPDFDAVVAALTNGVNDLVFIDLLASPGGGGGGLGQTEAGLFFGDPSGVNGIDFAGASISSIALRLDSLTLETPGQDPNGDGNWIDMRATFTLIISGEGVPSGGGGCPSVGICITKTASPDPVAVGRTLTYTIVITDTGVAPYGTILIDDLPAGVDFVSATTTPPGVCGGGPVQVVCGLPSGPSNTVTVEVVPRQTGTITNTATVVECPGCPPLATGSVTTTVVPPTFADLSLVKRGRQVGPGLGAYVFYVGNAGPSAATQVRVTDPLPPGTGFFIDSSHSSRFTCEPVAGLAGQVSCTFPSGGVCELAGGVVTCDVGTLGVDAFSIVSFEVFLPSTPFLIDPNTASVSSNEVDPNPTNNTASAVIAANIDADLSVRVDDSPDPVVPGAEITYTVGVENRGPNPATSVFVEFLTSATVLSMGGPGWGCSRPSRFSSILCTRPALDVGPAPDLTIRVVAPDVAGVSALGTARASASNPDPYGTNNVAEAGTQVGIPPRADAGVDQMVVEGAAVTLDGSKSTPLPLTFHWSQIAGLPVTLSDPWATNPTFVAPILPGGVHNETLTFELTVLKPGGSGTDTVNVTVKNVNHAPTAAAGLDQTVNEGSPVILSGTPGSFDPDSDPISYLWEQVSGPRVELTGAATATATFTTPLVPGGIAGTEVLLFKLTVSDSVLLSTDEVQVTVEQVNHAPTARAGSAQTKDEGSAVTLDGSGSSDPDGDALTSFAWQQVGGPPVLLSGPSGPTPTFTAPLVAPGGVQLVFQLVVSDGALASEPDRVIVTVVNVNDPPRCDLASANPAVLWPPDHKLMPVAIVGVSDPNSDRVTITVTGVTQDEPLNGTGDGDTSPDAVLQGAGALLRAERDQNGNGRVYGVHFRADDGRVDGACDGVVMVGAPTSLRPDVEAVDDGQLYNSLQP